MTVRRRAHSSPRKGGDPENTLMLWARGNEGGGFQCLGWCWNVRIYLPCRLPGPVREPPERTGLQLIEKWENQALNSLTPTLPNVLSHPVSYWLKTGVRHPRFQVAEEPQNPPVPQLAITRNGHSSFSHSLCRKMKGKGEGGMQVHWALNQD